MRRSLFGVALLLGLLVLAAAGCYVSKYTIGPKDQATVDRKYVGDWEFPDPDKPAKAPMRVVIRNLDDKQYYVEWSNEDGGPTRTVGFVTDVKGVSFVQLRPLSDDGSNENEYLIMRVSLSSDDKLTLRQLDEGFFKPKTIDSSAALRKVIEENLDKDDMYADKGLVGTRIAKQ